MAILMGAATEKVANMIENLERGLLGHAEINYLSQNSPTISTERPQSTRARARTTSHGIVLMPSCTRPSCHAKTRAFS